MREEPSECPPTAAYISFGVGQWASVLSWPWTVMLLFCCSCCALMSTTSALDLHLCYTLDRHLRLCYSPAALSVVEQHHCISILRALRRSYSTLRVSKHNWSVCYPSMSSVAVLQYSICICCSDDLASVTWNREVSEFVFPVIKLKVLDIVQHCFFVVYGISITSLGDLCCDK